MLLTCRNKSVWDFPSYKTRSALAPILRRVSTNALLQMQKMLSDRRYQYLKKKNVTHREQSSKEKIQQKRQNLLIWLDTWKNCSEDDIKIWQNGQPSGF